MNGKDPTGPNGEKYVAVGGWITAVKGLTITNAVVIIMLVFAGAPAYFVYSLVNNGDLLDRFLSSFKVYNTNSGCTVRRSRQRGEPFSWGISTGFAFEGGDRWAVGVGIDHEPTSDEAIEYCETLKLIVDYMRNPGIGEIPVFPGTSKPLIWKEKEGTASDRHVITPEDETESKLQPPPNTKPPN